MMNFKYSLGIVVILVLSLGVLFVVLQEDGSGIPFLRLSDSEVENVVVEKDPAVVSNDVIVQSENVALPLTYRNTQFGFEIDLPEGYTGSSFVEGSGVTALLKNPETGEGFQIYIQAFDETESITLERIKQDVPGLVIENPQNALIAGGEIEALIFIGESEDFGKTREVWFVKDGLLFQVIAPFEMEQTVGLTMESFQFIE